jgi:YggT family protein
MFVLANLLTGVAHALSVFLTVFFWILIARAIVSWVNADPRNVIVRFLYLATEPPIRAVRRLLPASLRYFPLDIAFLVVLGLVIFAQHGIVQSLLDYSLHLRRQGLQQF